MLYYLAFTLIALMLFIRRPRGRGMRLRLRGRMHEKPMADGRVGAEFDSSQLEGAQPPSTSKEQKVERPLNVVFNYNGHSWDAYEVLGLPAGSSPDKVEDAYKASAETVDAGSRPFLEAAYQAIQNQWQVFKASSQ